MNEPARITMRVADYNHAVRRALVLGFITGCAVSALAFVLGTLVG
jgi:hypothetical protein